MNKFYIGLAKNGEPDNFVSVFVRRSRFYASNCDSNSPTQTGRSLNVQV